jgi:arylsulfatase A-like enzyme
VEFITENRDRPFFLFLSYTKPHRPVMPSDEFRGTSDHGLYGDAVEEIDWSVGEVMQTISGLGLDEQTFVIFTSDNGPWIRGAYKRKVKGGSTGPLRGGKGTAWEGGLRVPMIAKWPGRLPGGQTRDGIATIMDIFPTLIGLAGAELPGDRVIDGKDFLGYLEGQAGAPHDVFYYYFRSHLFAVREGEWKLHMYKREAPEADREMEKPVLCEPPELYNLISDSGESANVAAQHPEIVARLQRLGEEFDGSFEPVMVLPPPSTSMYQGVTSGAPKNPDRVPHAKPRNPIK